ncbi:MAG TPA: hypothetical protein VNS58_20155 [Puia sp.]|nr:hypothetical protein [Puia sp.]
MQKRKLKRIALTVLSVFLSLVLVLCAHIYIVTRPKAPDEKTRIMARIDIKQPITQEDAARITAWLYNQKGVDHVLVNPQSAIAVFTFAPVKNNANQIVIDFKASLPYKAERYLPTAAEMTGGCPAMASSGYKVISFIRNIF